MLPGAASVITAAIRSPCSAKAASTAGTSLYGSTIVSAAALPWIDVGPGVAPAAARVDADD